MHLPINHRFRQLYRALAGSLGVALVGYGLFADDSFALAWIGVGAMAALGALIGRNVDHYVNLGLGGLLWLSGLGMLALGNVRGCAVAYVAGTILVLCGAFGKTGTEQQELAEDLYQHSGRSAER